MTGFATRYCNRQRNFGIQATWEQEIHETFWLKSKWSTKMAVNPFIIFPTAVSTILSWGKLPFSPTVTLIITAGLNLARVLPSQQQTVEKQNSICCKGIADIFCFLHMFGAKIYMNTVLICSLHILINWFLFYMVSFHLCGVGFFVFFCFCTLDSLGCASSLKETT